MAFPMDIDRPGASDVLVWVAGFSPGADSTRVYMSCEDGAWRRAAFAHPADGSTRQQAIGTFGFMTLANLSERNMFGLHSMR